MKTNSLIDENQPSSMSYETLSMFSTCLRGAGFESVALLELFGKEVMRYVNISSLEKTLLRDTSIIQR